MSTRTALLALALIAIAPAASAQQRAVITYDTLDPYGDWVVTPSYGRVWRPRASVVGADFVPYASSGQWVHTDYGWEFDAPWEWAWLPFHYGRWYQDEAYGWVWVPGDVWAPAWVEWRFGGGYVGWAPLGPPHWHSRWYYVEQQHFAAADFWRHRANEAHEQDWYRATRPIPPPSGRAYAAGPGVEQIRAVSRVPVVERAARPGGRGEVRRATDPSTPLGVNGGRGEVRRATDPSTPLGVNGGRGEERRATDPSTPLGVNGGRGDERRTRATFGDGRPPVPAAALPPPATPIPRGAAAPPPPPPAALAPSRGDGRPPMPAQSLPPPASPDKRPRPEARPAEVIAPAARHERVEPPPMHEPSRPGQEPFHPMIEPSPPRGGPTVVRPAAPPQAAPPPAPSKRPQLQPAVPAGPAPAPRPGRAHPVHP